VYFRDKDTLVGVAQSGQVLACDLTLRVPDQAGKPPPAVELLHFNQKKRDVTGVYRAELVEDGKWLLVANLDPGEPHVLLRSIDGKQTVKLPLGADRFPRSIAWHPKLHQLAVGVGRALDTGKAPRFYSEGAEEIWIYDDPIKNPKAEPKKIPHPGRAEALAFHPVLPHLALAGGDADEITVLALSAPEKPLTVARGAGQRPSAVNISASGKIVGVQIKRDPASTNPNARGTGAWTRFDLKLLKPTLDESQDWVNPLSGVDGWVIEPGADRFVWYAVRGGTKLHLLLDRNRDLGPTCYTFLPAKPDKPTRVLVGHYYGCTLFELVPARAVKGALAGTKVFTGHAGEVTSIVADGEQKWFVTGGTDHTVAGWSLADWKSEPGLGARFAAGDGSPVVSAVDVASPAWEAGLRVGDVIDLLAVDNKLVFDRRKGEGPFGTVEDVLGALKAPRPRIELYFGIAARGAADRWETLSTVRQRPLWKWFPAFDHRDRLNDWVVWMWHGSYYHTKTASGDRLAGWHVNAPEPGERPRFYQLQQFEKQFHRPEVLDRLMETLDAGAALVAARGANPVIESFTRHEPPPVRLAVAQTTVPATGLPLTITVNPRGNNPDLLPQRVELWLNDYLVETWPKAGAKIDPKKPFVEPVTLPAEQFRTGANQLTVLVFNAAGGRTEDTHLVHRARAAGGATLLALLVGINDYSDTRRNVEGARKFGDLAYATTDATDLRAQLLTFTGPKHPFTDAKLNLRLGADAVRKNLTADLAALARRARPDDLLVVFFAGHGDLLMPRDGPLPPNGRAALPGEGVFFFCCPDYSPTAPDKTALSVEELFAALARINCRKLVLIDACRSGRAAAPNLLRRCVPNGQGPLIIASCAQGELAYEATRFGHGLFTYALLDALDTDRNFRKADYNSDGALSAEELYEYVAAEVPLLARKIGKKTETQTPICFPRQLPKTPLLRK
jgi:uncharacterized caspase-like protein